MQISAEKKLDLGKRGICERKKLIQIKIRGEQINFVSAKKEKKIYFHKNNNKNSFFHYQKKKNFGLLNILMIPF